MTTESPALDRIDLKILAALQAEGRISNQALAERVALSPSACLARVRRLEADGTISGYQAQIAIERVRPTVMILAQISIARYNPSDFAKFEEFVGAIPEVVEVSEVSGAFDYLLKVVVRDIRAWRELSEHILSSDLGVGKVSSHVIMKTSKPFQGYPI